MTIHKETFTLGSAKLFAEKRTPEEQTFETPLVFVHGSFGGYFMWEKIVSYLVGQGFATVAFSLRGHKPSGEADLSSLAMQDYVDDVETVVKELELGAHVVVGHSLGGLVALMYSAQHAQKVRACVAVDPSTTKEVSGEMSEEKVQEIPLVYTPAEAGMPKEPEKVMQALPDIPKEMLGKMKEMLGPESGAARRDRKRGISVPKESLTMPLLMIGAELGGSVPFGITAASTKRMAEFYGADFAEVEGASHPGIVMGTHAGETAQAIAEWLRKLS